MKRRIRVHIGHEPTFVIEAEHGFITSCSRTRGEPVIGRNESDVAEEYRALGATFVDLVNDRTEIRVARGYRPRDTSVPFGTRRSSIVRKDADGEPVKRTPRKKPDAKNSGVNHIVESLKTPNPPKPDETFPF